MKFAVRVGFGDDGEATGAGSQTRRIGGFKYFRILTVCSYSLVQVRVSQSQRHVPRHEPWLALGIQQDAEADAGQGVVSAVPPPCCFLAAESERLWVLCSPLAERKAGGSRR